MMKCFQKWLDIYYRERNLEIKKKNEKDKPTAEDPSVTRKTSKEVTLRWYGHMSRLSRPSKTLLQ